MNLKYETKKLGEGYKYVIGCDEVGRGCLAGPVVAAAVVLPVESYKVYNVIKDSKLLSAKKREELSMVIKEIALAWSIAEVSSAEIDEINIHNASLLAMRKAVERMFTMSSRPSLSASEGERRDPLSEGFIGLRDSSTRRMHSSLGMTEPKRLFIFVDGKFIIPNYSEHQQAIIGGDNKVLSIAAASIIAKVYRDELMQKFDKQYPAYYLGKHKGYATTTHRQAIIREGLSPIHRVTFCKNFL